MPRKKPAQKKKNEEDKEIDDILNFLDSPSEPKTNQSKNKKKQQPKNENKTNQPLKTKNNVKKQEKPETSKNELESKPSTIADEKKVEDNPKPVLSKMGQMIQQRRLLQKKQEEKRLQLLQEQERIEREKKQEEERLEEERLALIKAKKQAKKDEIAKAKAEGTYLTPSEKKKREAMERAKQTFIEAGMINLNDVNLSPSVNKESKSKAKKQKKQKKDLAEVIFQEEKVENLSEDDKLEENIKNTNDKDESSEDMGNWDDSSSETDETSNNPSANTDNKTAKGNDQNNLQSTTGGGEKEVQSTSQTHRNVKKSKATLGPADPNAELRSPICCVLGHVDTGKTKLLDKMRSTSVQDNEVGGITQQIGASFFPIDFVKRTTEALEATMASRMEYRLPGLLVIDTPGHESFSNLRKRGSTLCDIAVLVVDIMHGIEPQTEESLRILKSKRTPFVVALNKIDKIFEWTPFKGEPFVFSIAKQGETQKDEFRRRLASTVLQLNKLGLNCALYHENKDVRSTVSIVPTSAFTGEGIPDLLRLIVQLTQNRMSGKLELHEGVECSVLEVMQDEGLGYTANVILSNGQLCVGDQILLCGLNGPIVTTIRAIYEPSPLKEIRFRGGFRAIREVRAAAGVKICAPELDKAIAGTNLLVCREGDDLESLKEEVMSDYTDLSSKVDPSGNGVCVQSSTLGALEAFLDYLRTEKIPVHKIAIGPVRKKDVMAASVMLDKKPEYAVILAFNVKVDKETEAFAESMKVKIFKGEIIYNLRDFFVEYLKKYKEKEREENKKVVFPVKLSIIKEYVIMKHNPIILGMSVEEGRLVPGTPLVALRTEVQMSNLAGTVEENVNYIRIGTVESIELDKKTVKTAKEGDKVSVKINQSSDDSHIYYGRQFDHENVLCSLLTRASIDNLKEQYKDNLSEKEWRLVIKMKKVLGIH